MKLTNKQLEIVVDEIYDRVSKPVIEANKKKLDSVKLDEQNDEYLKDLSTYRELEEKATSIREEMESLSNKYKKTEFNGFYFGYSPMSYSDEYVKYQKERRIKLDPILTKEFIEKQVILSDNKEIPELIKSLVSKLKTK